VRRFSEHYQRPAPSRQPPKFELAGFVAASQTVSSRLIEHSEGFAVRANGAQRASVKWGKYSSGVAPWVWRLTVKPQIHWKQLHSKLQRLQRHYL
jgi:hypothetical protein